MDLTVHTKTQKEQPGQPTNSGMTMGNIWFVSPKHKENFTHLLEKFNAYRSAENASAAYIVAHPEIHYRINWDNYTSPVDFYWGEWVGNDDNDEKGFHTESPIIGQLSSAYAGLVRVAVELYTGRSNRFDLMAWLGNAGDEVFKVFIQALEIRRDRLVIEL